MLGTRRKLESVEVGVGNFDILGLTTTIGAHGYEIAELVYGSKCIRYCLIHRNTDRHSHKHHQQNRG